MKNAVNEVTIGTILWSNLTFKTLRDQNNGLLNPEQQNIQQLVQECLRNVLVKSMGELSSVNILNFLKMSHFKGLIQSTYTK